MISCPKCKKEFTLEEKVIYKKGPLFNYIRCPFCQKIFSVKKEETVSNAYKKVAAAVTDLKENKPVENNEVVMPLLITREMFQALLYPRTD